MIKCVAPTAMERVKRVIPVAVLALIFLVGFAGAAHITTQQLSDTNVALGDANVTDANLNVVSYDFKYTGRNVTQVDVTVENTAGSDITTDVEVVLLHGSTQTASGTASSVTVPANGQTTASITTVDTSITQVETVEITVRGV